MMKNRIIETVNVTIKTTPEELVQTVVGNSVSMIGKIAKRYIDAKESYTNDGYKIIADDFEKLSFVAEKISEVE